MFWGNTALNAFTTAQSIQTTGLSSCEGGTNYKVGAWIPALYNSSGEVVVPEQTYIYYKTFDGPSMNYSRVQVVPQGLGMLASPRTLNFDENAIRIERYQDAGRSWLRFSLSFPSCVATDNGQMTGNPILSFRDMPGNLATQVNSNVAYPGGGNEVGCPTSHPYRFPTPQFIVLFDANQTGSAPYLSSDVMENAPRLSTLHGDYMFGADPSVNQAFLQCVRESRSCGFDGGGRGQLPDRFFGPSGRVYSDGITLLNETDRTPFGALPAMRSSGTAGHSGHGNH
jgi:hypothetical protein